MGLNDSRETAAFNLAMPYLLRINSVLNANYNEFKKGNIGGFAVNLRQLYREIKPWLRQTPKKEVDDVTPFEQAFVKLSKIPKKNTDAIWKQMEEIEMMLRQHFKELGMLMPKVNDPRFLFGNKQK